MYILVEDQQIDRHEQPSQKFMVYGETFALRNCHLLEIDKPIADIFNSIIEANPEGATYTIPVDWLPYLNETIANTLKQKASRLITRKRLLKKATVKMLLKHTTPATTISRIEKIEWVSPSYAQIKGESLTSVWGADASKEPSLSEARWAIASDKGQFFRGTLADEGSTQAELHAILQVPANMTNKIALILTDSISAIELLRTGEYDNHFEDKAVCVRYERAHLQNGLVHSVADWATRETEQPI